MRENVIKELKYLSEVSNVNFEDLLNDALSFKKKYDLTDSNIEKFIKLNLSFYTRNEGIPKENIFRLIDGLHSSLKNVKREETFKKIEEYKSKTR